MGVLITIGIFTLISVVFFIKYQLNLGWAAMAENEVLKAENEELLRDKLTNESFQAGFRMIKKEVVEGWTGKGEAEGLRRYNEAFIPMSMDQLRKTVDPMIKYGQLSIEARHQKTNIETVELNYTRLKRVYDKLVEETDAKDREIETLQKRLKTAEDALRNGVQENVPMKVFEEHLEHGGSQLKSNDRQTKESNHKSGDHLPDDSPTWEVNDSEGNVVPLKIAEEQYAKSVRNSVRISVDNRQEKRRKTVQNASEQPSERFSGVSERGLNGYNEKKDLNFQYVDNRHYRMQPEFDIDQERETGIVTIFEKDSGLRIGEFSVMDLERGIRHKVGNTYVVYCANPKCNKIKLTQNPKTKTCSESCRKKVWEMEHQSFRIASNEN